MEQQEYFFIRMPKHQVDLEDLFGGVYNDDTGEWRFDKSKESDVFAYLHCSSDESEEEVSIFLDKNTSLVSENVLPDLDEVNPTKLSRPPYKGRDRLHRANSFNASDSSDESDSSLEENYRRSRGVRVNDLTLLKLELKKAQQDD